MHAPSLALSGEVPAERDVGSIVQSRRFASRQSEGASRNHSSHTRNTSHTIPRRDTLAIIAHSIPENGTREVHHGQMSTHALRFRPSLITALVKVAMIGTWRGRTFLDDNREYDDIADFVAADRDDATPLDDALPLQVSAPAVSGQPAPVGQSESGRPGSGPADRGHSVAA